MIEEHSIPQGAAGSQYHFIPAVAKDELRLIQEMLTLALTGKSSFNIDIWVTSETKEIRFVHPQGLSTEEARLAFRHRMVAARSLTKALKDSELRALVQSTDGGLYRIDRMYWLRVSVENAETVVQLDGMVPSAFVGQPIVADLAELSRWREIADSLSVSGRRNDTDASEVASAAATVPVRPARQARTTSLPQRRLAKFFAIADTQDLDHLVHERLFDEYRRWNDVKNKGALTHVHQMKLSAFKKWRGRWRSGERWC